MRKEPRQARSRATVETIVQAATRVLSEEGWAGFSTNRVAELAGVSIGSLYQYFPDKFSLVDAVRDRHLDDCLTAVRRRRAKELSPAQFVASLVDDMIAAHSLYPGLHRVLLDEAPSADAHRDPNSEFERKYLAYYADAVAAYRKCRPEGSSYTAALIISDAIDGVIHNAARRGALGDPSIRNELVHLVGLYLVDEGEGHAA